MPVSMKRPIEITVHVPKATAALVAVSSGANTTGQVAINLEQGDATGYEDLWDDRTIPAYFHPGVLKKWDREAEGFAFMGESSLTVEPAYEDLLDSADYLSFNNVDWDFSRYTELGAGFGNDRIVLALFRRR